MRRCLVDTKWILDGSLHCVHLVSHFWMLRSYVLLPGIFVAQHFSAISAVNSPKNDGQLISHATSVGLQDISITTSCQRPPRRSQTDPLPWHGRCRRRSTSTPSTPITKGRASLVALVLARVDEEELPLGPADEVLVATLRRSNDELRRAIEADDADAARVMDEEG